MRAPKQKCRHDCTLGFPQSFDKLALSPATLANLERLGYTREQVGKIAITEFATYVAVDRKIAHDVVARLNSGKIKGRTVRARLLKD